MMKLEDVINFYIGVDLYAHIHKVDAGKLIGVKRDMNGLILTTWYDGEEDSGWLISDIKPLLRPLSDITKTELDEYNSKFDVEYKAFPGIARIMQEASAMIYLASREFDLFGLIKSGQAIDKTKLK